MPVNYYSRSARVDLAARARELAASVDALAAKIAALHQDISTAEEAWPRAGFRCSTAIGSLRQAAQELRDTATDLDRIAAATVPGTCGVPWGVCPEHGNTLISSGGRTWCRDASCQRTWDYDRSGLPCTEPAHWTVTDRCVRWPRSDSPRIPGRGASHDPGGRAAGAAMTDRLIRITTALAVATVATVAAVISYRHAYELVSTHGETE